LPLAGRQHRDFVLRNLLKHDLVADADAIDGARKLVDPARELQRLVRSRAEERVDIGRARELARFDHFAKVLVVDDFRVEIGEIALQTFRRAAGDNDGCGTAAANDFVCKR
jgi:hypothetical protein